MSCSIYTRNEFPLLLTLVADVGTAKLIDPVEPLHRRKNGKSPLIASIRN